MDTGEEGIYHLFTNMVIQLDLVGNPPSEAITGVSHEISGAYPPNNLKVFASFVECHFCCCGYL
jgi:hypothetical protein